MRVCALIEDWDLPYHQGRALEYIYQSLFEYGEKRHKFLNEMEDILCRRLAMIKNKKK